MLALYPYCLLEIVGSPTPKPKVTTAIRLRLQIHFCITQSIVLQK